MDSRHVLPMRNGQANKKNRSKKREAGRGGRERKIYDEKLREGKRVNEGEKREMKDFLLPHRKRNNGG